MSEEKRMIGSYEVTQSIHILTLVTCEYSQDNGRLAVVAMKT